MNHRYYSLSIVISVVAGFFGGLLAGAFVSPDPATAQKSPVLTRVVTAEEFRVVDEQGRVVVSLGTEPSLLSRLNLYDREGNLRASLNVSAVHETAGLELYAKRDDVQSLRVQTRPDGLASVVFLDESGAPAAALGTAYEDTGEEGAGPRPSLKFFDAGQANKVFWRAP